MDRVHEAIHRVGDPVQVEPEVTALRVGHHLGADEPQTGNDAAVRIGGVRLGDPEIDARHHVGVAAGYRSRRRCVDHQHVEHRAIVAGDGGGTSASAAGASGIRAGSSSPAAWRSISRTTWRPLVPSGSIEYAASSVRSEPCRMPPARTKVAALRGSPTTWPDHDSDPSGFAETAGELRAKRATGRDGDVNDLGVERGEVRRRCTRLHRVCSRDDVGQCRALQARGGHRPAGSGRPAAPRHPEGRESRQPEPGRRPEGGGSSVQGTTMPAASRVGTITYEIGRAHQPERIACGRKVQGEGQKTTEDLRPQDRRPKTQDLKTSRPKTQTQDPKTQDPKTAPRQCRRRGPSPRPTRSCGRRSGRRHPGSRRRRRGRGSTGFRACAD